jgi:Helix-turn-helix domain
VEHRQVEDRPATSRRASGDDPARFLQELRQLRDGAGLGQAELAARAHYPYDRIKAAEVGPTLPDLPVLSAYVRGCGGTTEEWEERWRSLTSAPTLPLLDARPAGCSTAASAGARIGSITPVADTPDPSIIMAALDRVAEEMAVATPAAPPSRSGVSTIEQRPAFPVPPPAAAAKSASGKAGTGKVTAWEATTRTAWSSATGPLAWEAGQPTAVDGPTTAAAARRPAAESAGTVAPNAGPAEASAATSAKTGSAGSVGAAGADGFSGSAATKTVSGAAGAASTTAAAGPAAVGRRSRALSRTTVAALIAIAICLLVALLAMVA